MLRSLGWVGVENIQLTGLPPSQGGSRRAGQVRGLIGGGWELDTQGISHADLITLDAERLHYQVAVARAIAPAALPRAGQLVLLPVGPLRRDGHRGGARRPAYRVDDGRPRLGAPEDDPYRLPRLRVLGGTTGRGLLELVNGARANPPAPASYSA